MNCQHCNQPTALNTTAPATDDGLWCEPCQSMTYPKADCNCAGLDDDLIQDGWTCYNCHAPRKDNPEN